jgi:hypothetical protein
MKNRRGPSAAVLAILLGCLALYPSAAAPEFKREPIQAPQPQHPQINPAAEEAARRAAAANLQKTDPCAANPDGRSAPATMMHIVRPQTTPVPSLYGMTLDQVKSAIAGKLRLRVADKQIPGYIVINQSPQPSNSVPLCTFVAVAMGPRPTVNPHPPPLILVPDITRLPENSIQGRLNAIHLNYGGTSQKETKDYPPGTMFAQNPTAGTRVLPGKTVIRYQAYSPATQPALQVNLIANARSLVPGETVTFTAQLAPPQRAAEYQFDFGDRTPGVTSNQPRALHTYQQDGNYSVRVAVTANDKQAQSPVLGITVHDVVYAVSLRVSPQIAHTGQTVDFEAEALPQVPETTRPEYIFYFGDGSNPRFSATPVVQHTYANAKAYQATVILVADHGHKIPSDPVEVSIATPPLPPSEQQYPQTQTRQQPQTQTKQQPQGRQQHTPPVETPPLLPLWAYFAMGTGLAGVLGAGGFKWVKRNFNRRVNVVANVGTGVAHPRESSGAVVEEGFGVRAVHPPPISNARYHSLVITKIERLA